MIERYSRPEMAGIWSDAGRYERWLQVELAVCEVHAERGLIPAASLETIRAKAAVDLIARAGLPVPAALEAIARSGDTTPLFSHPTMNRGKFFVAG